MFVIIGTQVKKEELGCIPEPRICPRCRRLVHYQVIREQRWFTVFWVPLFPVQSRQYIQCPSCGLALQIDDLQMNELQTADPQMGQPQTMISDKSADANGSSALKKGARQAGRLAGRLKKRLDEMI